MINHASVNGTIEELRADVERLRRENADLRASALLWKRLYEQALTPGSGAEVEVIARASAGSALQPTAGRIQKFA